MTARNAWLSWKRVTRVPNNVAGLARVVTSQGKRVDLGVQDGSGGQPYPALYLAVEDQSAAFRVGLGTLVESVIASEGRGAETWEPLTLADNSPAGGADELWGNALLTASKRLQPNGSVVLSYHWRDRAPIHDWRVMQRVKNELAGPEWEAIEFFPAESRLVDEANEYWMQAFPPEHPLYEVLSSMGYQRRSVMTQEDLDATGDVVTAVQRDDDGTVLR